MAKYAHIVLGAIMKLSQIISMLNGLLLSTNVVAITLNITDELYVQSYKTSEWTYSNTQFHRGDSIYFINE